MERTDREHWGMLGKLLDEISKSGEDLVIGADGRVSPGQALKGCAVSYVNCRTKETEIQTLKEGETFCYGDWDGTTCVRKTFTC